MVTKGDIGYNRKGLNCLYKAITCQEDSGCKNCNIFIESQKQCYWCGHLGENVVLRLSPDAESGEFECTDMKGCIKRIINNGLTEVENG